MSTNKRYEELIKLLKEWLNADDDHDLKYFGEDMRDRSKKIKTAIAPKMNITKKPEIDRILEEAEAHMPKRTKSLPDYPLKSRQAQCVSVPRGEKIASFTEALRSSQKASDFISSVNKEVVISSLWQAIQSNIEGLKTLIGEESSLKIAAQRIEFCIEDWKVENAVD